MEFHGETENTAASEPADLDGEALEGIALDDVFDGNSRVVDNDEFQGMKRRVQTLTEANQRLLKAGEPYAQLYSVFNHCC